MYTEYRRSVEDHMMQGQVWEFMYRVYGWMSAALVVTACVAYYVAQVPALQALLFRKPTYLIGICIAQFALVMVLGFFLNRMSYAVASILFIVYAATLGLTLSSIFLVYEISSIGITFLVTAGMFGAMCLYGYTTRTDLTTLGNMAMMALFGMIIAMLANFYFQNQMMDYIVSGIGVLVFTVLTATDAQKIKQVGYQALSQGQSLDKISVIGALTLYLDFVNLFLFLLRFLGARKDN